MYYFRLSPGNENVIGIRVFKFHWNRQFAQFPATLQLLQYLYLKLTYSVMVRNLYLPHCNYLMYSPVEGLSVVATEKLNVIRSIKVCVEKWFDRGIEVNLKCLLHVDCSFKGIHGSCCFVFLLLASLLAADYFCDS